MTQQAPTWVAVVQKITVEEEKGHSASGKDVNKIVTTTRTWYINKDHQTLTPNMIRVLELVGGMPET